jgi:hypothetical protein
MASGKSVRDLGRVKGGDIRSGEHSSRVCRDRMLAVAVDVDAQPNINASLFQAEGQSADATEKVNGRNRRCTSHASATR